MLEPMELLRRTWPGQLLEYEFFGAKIEVSGVSTFSSAEGSKECRRGDIWDALRNCVCRDSAAYVLVMIFDCVAVSIMVASTSLS